MVLGFVRDHGTLAQRRDWQQSIIDERKRKAMDLNAFHFETQRMLSDDINVCIADGLRRFAQRRERALLLGYELPLIGYDSRALPRYRLNNWKRPHVSCAHASRAALPMPSTVER